MTEFILGVGVGALLARVGWHLWAATYRGRQLLALMRAEEQLHAAHLRGLRDLARGVRVPGATPLGFTDRDVEAITRPDSIDARTQARLPGWIGRRQS